MSMGKPFRAAIVGCGAISCGNDAQWLRQLEVRPPLTHAGAYRVNPATTLVAAADVDRTRLERFGRDWGVPALYADYRELLRKERVDMLSVCTPTALHTEVVVEAAQLGVHAIFCEKPLAGNPKEAQAALLACEERGTVLAVNYFRRWNPTLADWAKQLAAGELGRIRRATAYYTKGVLSNGTHAIDLIQWWVGGIKWVQTLGNVFPEESDCSVDARCLTESGVPCDLRACRQEDFNILELDLFTDRGRIRLIQNARRLERYGVIQDPNYDQYRILEPEPEVTPTAWQECMSRAVEDLVACLETGAAPRCGGREASAAVNVAAAIQVSAREGGRVIELSSIGLPIPVVAGKQVGLSRRFA